MFVTFDTQEVVNELKNHGFTDEQAEVLTRIQKQVIHDSMDTTLASKGDINELKNIIQNSNKKNDSDFTCLDKKIDTNYHNTTLKIEQLNSQLIVIKWMLGVIIAVEVLPLLKPLF